MTGPKPETQWDRIARMADRMLETGKSEQEVEAFVRRAAGRQQQNEAEAPRQSAGQALMGGAMQAINGLTFGLGDELTALRRRAYGVPYEQGLADVRAPMEQFRQENPKSALALNVAGAFLNPVQVTKGIAAFRPAAGAGLGAKVGLGAARGATEGAIQGAAQGAGEATAGNRLAGAGRGAAFGALFGGGLGGGVPLGQAAGRAINRLRQPSGEKALEELVDKVGPDVAQSRLEDMVLAGRGQQVRPMDVLGPEAAHRVRQSIDEGGQEVADVVTPRLTGAGHGERFLGDVETAAGAPRETFEEGAEQFARRRSRAVAPGYAQARREAQAFDAITPRVDERWNQMEQVAGQKALPGPGQSVSAKRDLPDMTEDVAWPGVPSRRPRETVAQEGAREALESRGANQRLDAQGGERRVELRAANDINVRRDPEVPAEVPASPNRFAKITDALDEAVARPEVQREMARLRAKFPSRFGNVEDTDYNLLSRALRELNKQARREGGTATGADIEASASVVRRALGERSPSFAPAQQQFAQVSEAREAFEEGQKALTKGLPFIQDAALTFRRNPEALERFKHGVVTDFFRRAAKSTPVEGFGDGSPIASVLGKVETQRNLKAALGDDFLNILGKRAKEELQLRASDQIVGAAKADEFNEVLDAMSNQQALDATIYAASGRGIMASVHLAKSATRTGQRYINRVTGRTARKVDVAERLTRPGAVGVGTAIREAATRSATRKAKMNASLEGLGRTSRSLLRSFVPEEDDR